MAITALITMDDLDAAVRINGHFEQQGHSTILVSSLDDSVAVLNTTEPDILILTGALQERLAKGLISLARRRSVQTLGLIESDVGDPRALATRVGLSAFLVKPVEGRDVLAFAQNLIDRRRLQDRTGIVGESAAIQEVLVKIEQLAPVRSTVLIEGESGTGKELAARAIHDLSPRHDRPFVAVSCSALPETLLESELFGHEKGSFTGAAERRLGRFELADQGTLFLDEVGEMPMSTQVKLLRVLENRSFFRVGGTESIRVDVRVIAATNRSLKEQVSLGEFRDDLFYRLNVLSIYLPPLRERRSDIPILIERFVQELSEAHGRVFSGIAPDAMEILVNAHWPGNVRELRNLIDSMVVLAPGRKIQASDIPTDVREGGTRLLPMRMPQQVREVQGKELEFIFRSLMELKLQVEELRRHVYDRPEPVEAIDVGRFAPVEYEEIKTADDFDSSEMEAPSPPDDEVVYRPGMRMADVERATIEAALKVAKGNRRKAAANLGIGERTLYRKLKEYELEE